MESIPPPFVEPPADEGSLEPEYEPLRWWKEERVFWGVLALLLAGVSTWASFWLGLGYLLDAPVGWRLANVGVTGLFAWAAALALLSRRPLGRALFLGLFCGLMVEVVARGILDWGSWGALARVVFGLLALWGISDVRDMPVSVEEFHRAEDERLVQEAVYRLWKSLDEGARQLIERAEGERAKHALLLDDYEDDEDDDDDGEDEDDDDDDDDDEDDYEDEDEDDDDDEDDEDDDDDEDEDEDEDDEDEDEDDEFSVGRSGRGVS